MDIRTAIELLEEVKIMDDSMYQYNTAYLEALDLAINALKQKMALFGGDDEGATGNGDISGITEETKAGPSKNSVIDELKKWRDVSTDWAEKYGSIGNSTDKEIQNAAANAYQNAIEIVEKGCVN